MAIGRPSSAFAFLACGLAGPSAAQMPEYDPSVAFVSDTTLFVPFRVEATEPLADALADGRLLENTPVLLLEHPAGRLVLVTDSSDTVTSLIGESGTELRSPHRTPPAARSRHVLLAQTPLALAVSPKPVSNCWES